MPIIRNESAVSQCISDLNLTLRGKGDAFGADTANISDDQYKQSLGVRSLAARGVLTVLGEDDLQAEAERRAGLANALEAQRHAAAPGEVENVSGEELVPDGRGGWIDSGAQVTHHGGEELPSDNVAHREHQAAVGTIPANAIPADPTKVDVDPSQAVEDLLTSR